MEAVSERTEAAGSFGMLTAILLLTAVSWAAFLLEAAVLGYVPFFLPRVPHAYSQFHIIRRPLFHRVLRAGAGPGGDLVSAPTQAQRSPRKCRQSWRFMAAAAALLDPCPLRVPVPADLCAWSLAVLTLMQVSWTAACRLVSVSAAAAALLPLYVVLTIARSHDVAYLNGIFEMKNPATPIFITQPYMYIANNYDNFNCLVTELPAHSMGLKSLFPLWALTGLKFIKPELVRFSHLYHQGGADDGDAVLRRRLRFWRCGRVPFLGGPGFFCRMAHGPGREGRESVLGSFFILRRRFISCCHFLSTWYSNPATWFYFAATGAAVVWVELIKRLAGSRGRA